LWKKGFKGSRGQGFKGKAWHLTFSNLESFNPLSDKPKLTESIIFMNTVGIIGAGVMGQAAAAKLIEAGYPLIVFEILPASRKKMTDLGAICADSPADLARQTQTILLFLPGPNEVESCVLGEGGILSAAAPGGMVVDLSTIDPGTTRRLAGIAVSREVGYLDAPVLGRPSSVGNWALPVGGREEDLARVKPVLQTLASKIFLIGPSGMGQTIKLLNQLMFGAINAITAEMMALASHLGFEPRLLYETITASQAGTVSNLFKELGARIGEDQYANPTFTVDLLVKDVRLAAQMAAENGAPLLLTRTVEFINELAQTRGLGSEDTAVMWKMMKQLWEKED
jgi:3-hydroxyisobutyrate dehydrogenase